METAIIDPVKAHLCVLATEINILNDHAENHKIQALIYAARAGDKMNLAKQQLKHGEFIPWLEQNTKISRMQANNYMRLAKEYPQLLSEAEYSNVNSTVHLLSITQAIALMTATEDVKATVQEKIAAGESVTIAEINQLKQEKQQVEQKLKDAELAFEQKKQELQQDLEGIVGEVQSDMQAKIDSLTDKISELKNQINTGAVEKTQQELDKIKKELKDKQNKLDEFTQEVASIYSEKELNKKVNNLLKEIMVDITSYYMPRNRLLEQIREAQDKGITLSVETRSSITETYMELHDLSNSLLELSIPDIETTATENREESDKPVETEYHYYITEYNPRIGEIIVAKHNNFKSFDKHINKCNTVISTGYRSQLSLKLGDHLPMNKRERYFDGEFIK